MIFSLLGTITAIVHGLFVVFVMAGGLLMLRWSSLVWLHFPIAVYGVLIMLFDWSCPLTRWEILLRQKAGEDVEWTGFLHHYLFSRIGLTGNEWFVLVAILVALIAINYRPYLRVFQAAH